MGGGGLGISSEYELTFGTSDLESFYGGQIISTQSIKPTIRELSSQC